MDNQRRFGAFLAAWVGAVFVVFLFLGNWTIFNAASWAHYIPPIWMIRGSALVAHSRHLSQLALFWIITAGIGRVLLTKVFRLTALNSAEVLAFSFVLGCGIVSYVVFAMGALKALTPVVMVAFTGIAVLVSVLLNRDLVFHRKQQEGRNPYSVLTRGAGMAVTLFTVWILILNCFYALAPEVFYDALVYHLALPQLYRLSHGLIATPENCFSGIPFFQQMLYTWALFLGDEVLARLIHWSYAIALASGFFGLCLRFERPALGWLLCCAFLSTPLFGLNLSDAGVDAALTTMVFAATYALSLYFKGEEQCLSLLLLSALLAGFALSIKYTIWPFLPVILISLGILRAGPRRMAIYATISLGCLAPWVLKNVVYYGNPIYPYLHDVFQPASANPVDWRGFQLNGWGLQWNLILHSAKSFLEVILHPFYMTFRGISEADFVGPLFLALLPTVFLREVPAKRIWLLVCAGLWLCWWPVSAMPRFFMPGLSLLAAWGCLVMPVSSNRFMKWVPGIAFSLMILCNSISFAELSYRKGSWAFSIFGEPRNDYLRRPHVTYPTPDYSAVDWINSEAEVGSRVWVIGDPRAAYLERPFLASPIWNLDPLYIWLTKSERAEDLKAIVDREKIRYLLVNMAEAIRRPKNIHTTPASLEVLQAFFQRYTVRRFQEHTEDGSRWNEVYEVLPANSNPADQRYPLVEWLRYQMNPSNAER